jgi:hypothetical protein
MKTQKRKNQPSKDSSSVAKQSIAIASVVVAVGCLAVAAVFVPKLMTPKPITAKIVGAAWLTKGTGDSSIQRGLEISLCSADTSKAVIDQCCDYAQEAFKEKWKRENSNYMRESAERKVQELQARGVNVSVEQFLEKVQQTNPQLAHPQLSRFTQLHSSMGLIDEYIKNHSQKSAKTDIDGKFVLDNIKPGQYAVFGSFDNNASTGYWLVPVTLKAGDSLQLNLDNSNLTESCNESDRREGEG